MVSDSKVTMLSTRTTRKMLNIYHFSRIRRSGWIRQRASSVRHALSYASSWVSFKVSRYRTINHLHHRTLDSLNVKAMNYTHASGPESHSNLSNLSHCIDLGSRTISLHDRCSIPIIPELSITKPRLFNHPTLSCPHPSVLLTTDHPQSTLPTVPAIPYPNPPFPIPPLHQHAR
jgi:hypothetical protein